MNTPRNALVLCLLSAGLTMALASAASDDDAGYPILDLQLVAAVRFSLDQPYSTPWRKDRPIVSSGFVVVIRSDGTLIEPHAAPEPTLYAGSEVVEIVYRNPEAGIVAGVLRARKSLDGVDLWWGTPRYAESIDPEHVASERRRAVGAGLAPVHASALHRALSVRPGRKTFTNRGALYDFTTELGQAVASAKL